MIIRFTILIIAFSCLFSKQVIAVLDLDAINYTQEEAQVITTKIISEIINLNVYNVVERSNINRILSEQKLQNSGCTDSECAVEVGQLINADLIVIGSVSNFKELYSIDTKLINIETGEIIKIASFASEIDQKELFKQGVYDIAAKISGVKSNKRYKSQLIDNNKKYTFEFGFLYNRNTFYPNLMEKFIISNSLRIKYNLGDISLGYGLENKGVTFNLEKMENNSEQTCEVGGNISSLYSDGKTWMFAYHAFSLNYKLDNIINNTLRNSFINKMLYKFNISVGLKWMEPFAQINKKKNYFVGSSCSEPYVLQNEDIYSNMIPYIELSYKINNQLLISFEVEEEEYVLRSSHHAKVAISTLKLGYSF